MRMERALELVDDASSTRDLVVPRPPIRALTGLRFFAALLVLFSHFPELIPFRSPADGLERQGAAGVTIFFVLSGFVLTYRYGDTFRASPRGAGTFLRDRFARIAPMCAFALLLTTVAILALGATLQLRSTTAWFVNLFMLQSLVPTDEMNNWNIPAWSVSAELVFYCLFPFFVYFVLAKVRPRRLATFAAALFAIEVTLFVTVAVVVERMGSRSGKTPDDIDLMLSRLKFFPGLRMFEFFLGCVLGAAFVAAREGGHRTRFQVFEQRRVRNAGLVVAAIALGAILLLPSVYETPESGLVARLMSPGLYLAYTPLAVLIVAAIAWGSTAVTPVLEHPWSQVLGDASYSFYLLQGVMLVFVLEAGFAPVPHALWFSAIGVALLVVGSLLCLRWVERPGRRLLRSRRRYLEPTTS